MKNVLVTGADGFIGSHVTEQLVQAGYNVTALCWYNQNNSRGWLDDSPYTKDIHFMLGDIRDKNLMTGLIKGCFLDGVFHLAALNGIPYSYNAPGSYFDTNAGGTLNILDASQDCEKVVITSTSEVYGTAQFVPINEDHPINPQSPYAASKVAGDAFAKAYFRSFNTNVVIVRPFNTYGPRQSARAIIPTIITQYLTKETVSLGNLSPTRDFTYVEDTAKAFIKIAEQVAPNDTAINICTGTEISIGELANKILNMLGVTNQVIRTSSERTRFESSEVERLCGDNKRLRNLIGWIPGTSLDDGLQKTIEWIKQNIDKFKNVREYVK